MCRTGAAACLSDKRQLATFMEAAGIASRAPATALIPAELEDRGPLAGAAGDKALWFLKHAHPDNNAGISVHLGRAACCAAWLALPEGERGDYVAQREVPRVLLDAQGRKLTLRVYVLCVVLAAVIDEADAATETRAWALARREFVCRAHPLAYDAEDPDPARHVHSTVGKFVNVDCTPGSDWAPRDGAWPALISMLRDTFTPFLPVLARREVSEAGGAKAASFALLGVDVIVDTDMRPWLIEVNEMPALAPVLRDDSATAARESVVEDVLAATLDPMLASGRLQGAEGGGPAAAAGGAWEALASWSGPAGGTGRR